MSTRRSIADARTNLPRLVRDAESGERVELTRRGESVAVLIGRADYERLISRPRRFSEAWSDFTRTASVHDLRIDPDEVFGDVRDESAGRDIHL